ncbi:MAG: hypothetical protein RL189_1074 [Pseudomonadota bacterium]|jgi:hypothetical protein
MQADDFAAIRRTLKSLLSPLILILMAGVWMLFAFRSFAIEPFDVQEALFRRLGEELKAAGHWLPVLNFNGDSYPHSLPTFASLLALFSYLLDGSDHQISAFSARFLSLFFALGTAVLVHRTWARLIRRPAVADYSERKEIRKGIPPLLFVTMGFLPVLTSVVITPDVIFGFCVTLFYCSQALRIFSGGTSTLRGEITTFVTSILGLSGTVLLKGAAAVVFPFVVVIGFSAVEAKKQNVSSGLHFAKAAMWFATQRYGILLASFFATCACLGWWLWDDAFYLLTNSFDELPATGDTEGTAAGLSLTFASVICACSGLLVPWVGVLSSVSQRKSDAIRASEASGELAATRRWLLVSCLVVTLFSFFYSRVPTFWGMWPSLALFAALGGGVQGAKVPPLVVVVCRKFFSFYPFVLPVILLSLAVVVLVWQPLLSAVVPLGARMDAMVAAFLDEKYQLALGLFLTGGILFAAAMLFGTWAAQTYRRGYSAGLYSLGIARSLSLLQLSACTILMIVVAPVSEDVLTMPLQQSTSKARMFLGVNQKLATSGIFSPLVVSSNGGVVFMGSAEGDEIFNNPAVNVVLTPVWNLAACEKYGFDVAQAIAYLRVCLRSYQRTLEGPQE